MKSILACTALFVLLLPTLSCGPAPQGDPRTAASAAEATRPDTSDAPKAAAVEWPSLPEGVTELKFGELFKPIGRAGLEYTDKVKSLDGQRVRVLGYMVKERTPRWGALLLTAMPTQTNDVEYGLCDDLPPATLWVKLPPTHQTLAPYTPGLLLLTGTLEVGNKEEADGRISALRLVLDPPPRHRRIELSPVTTRPASAQTADASSTRRSNPRVREKEGVRE